MRRVLFYLLAIVFAIQGWGQNAATLPYSTNFEDTVDNSAWIISNSTHVNKWIFGTGVSATGFSGKSLFVSHNSVTNSYSTDVASVVTATRRIVNNGASIFQVSFDLNCQGETSIDYLKVYLTPKDTLYPAYVSMIYPANYPYYANSGYTNPYLIGKNGTNNFLNMMSGRYYYNIPASLMGNIGDTVNLIFVWKNNDNTGTQPPAAIDNIIFSSSSCASPTSLDVPLSTITTTTASVTWSSSISTSFTLEYKIDTQNWAQATVLQGANSGVIISGLLPLTKYNVRVRSECGTESSFWQSFTFTTACPKITSFPWNEGFENTTWLAAVTPSNEASPQCWINVNGGTTNGSWRAATFAGYIRTGVGAAQMYTSSSTQTTQHNDYLLSPVFTLTGNQGLKFWAKGDLAYSDSLAVMLYSISSAGHDFSSISDTTLLTTVMPSKRVSPTSFTEYEIDLTSFIGDYRIAFVRNQKGGYYLNLDDVSVVDYSICRRPTNVITSGATSTTVSVSFTPANTTDNTWYLFYKKAFEIKYDSLQVTSSTPVLSGLMPSTLYDLVVKTYCNAVVTEGTFPIQFRTACGSISSFPWIEGFEQEWEVTALAPGNSVAPTCWLNFNGGTPAGLWRANTSPSYIRSGIRNAQMYTASTSTSILHNDWLITPMFSLSGNQTLRFWAKGNSTYKDTLEVKVFNATTMQRDVLLSDTASNFITLMPKTSIPAEPYVEYELNLSQFVGDCRIAFVRNHKGGYYLNLDDIKIINNSLCKRPTNLRDTNVAATTADIKFTPGNTTDNAWWIYYNNTSTSVWDSVLATTNPFTLTNLVPNTVYQYFMRTNCTSEISEESNTYTFRTECTAVTSIPYSDSFDTYGTNSYTSWNYCWYRKSTYSPTSYPYISSQFFSSPGSLLFYAGGNSTANYYNIIVSPKFDPLAAPINSLRLKFKLFSVTSQGVEVGIMSDPKDSTTFTQIGSNITSSSLNTWEDKVVSFSNYTGAGTYIAFRCQAGVASNSFYIDDVVVEYMPQCAAPSTLAASAISHNSAQLSWTKAKSSDNAWWIYYKSTTASTYDSVYANTNPFTINNLLAQTTYTFYVKTACGNDISESSFSSNFDTKCSPVSVPYYESFDSYGNATFPTCWSKKSTGSADYPSLFTAHYTSSPSSLSFSAANTTYNLVVMPAIASPISINSLMAKFKIKTTSTAYSGLRVGVMTNPDDITTFVPMGGFIKSKLTSTHDSVDVSFISYTGTGRYIAILCEGIGGNNGSYIDDFKIDSIPSCAKPNNITVSSLSTTSATINWSTGNLNNTAWWLYYKNTSATTYDSVLVQNTTTYNLTNLTHSSKYQFYFVTSCGTDSSLPTDVYTFFTSCPTISSFPWYEGFETNWVDPSGISNESVPTNCWGNINAGASKTYKWRKNASVNIPMYSRTGTGSAQLYASNNPMGDYLLTPVLTLTGNQKVVFFGKGNTSTTIYPENLWVKVYNVTANGDIDSISDTTYFTNIALINDTNQYTWKEYEFPLTGLVGDYRVVFGRNNAIGYLYQIDDLKIDNLPPCPRPTTVNISNIQAHQANISWTAASVTDNAWEIYYRAVGSQNWDSVLATSNPYTLTNLFDNTEYEIEVKTVCSAGGYSDARFGGNFITSCDPTTTFPYFEGFEAAWAPAFGISNDYRPNTCWININGGDFTAQKWQKNSSTSSGYVKTGTGSLQLYGSNTSMGDYILSPVLTLTGNQKLMFWAKGYSNATNYPENVWVKVYNETLNGEFDSYSDTTLMTNIAFINDTNQYTWKEYEFPLTGLTGNYRIVFARNNSVGYYFHIDNLKIDNIAACQRPQSVTVSNIQQNSAQVSWVAGTPIDYSWAVFYRPEGSSAWDSVIVSTNPYTLTGLSASTLYELEVKTDCGNGAFSDSREAGSFRTSCGTITAIPWYENFNSYSTGSAIVPACWTRNSSTATTPSISSSGFSMNGIYFYASSSGPRSMIYTPEFGSSIAMNTLKLNFKFKSSTPTHDTLRIGVATDTTLASWVEVAKVFGPSTYSDYEVSLASYTGTGKYIAFRADYGTQSTYAYLDNLVVSYNITCSDPTSLTASSITQTSATIGWTPGASETNWQVKIGLSGTPVDIQTPSYSFSGLTHNTAYTAYVRANCTGGFYSNWVPVTFTTLVTPSNPIVNTSSVTTFTYNTATLGGTYTQMLDTVTAIGLEYKTASAANWTNQSVSPVASPFVYQATGLIQNTIYKVRAYATTNAGNFYGDTVTFTTAAFNLPVVTTDSVVILTPTSAKYYGAITQGTESIVARGFEFKTAAQTWSSAQDLTATGTNTITATATGLDTTTTYNVRAYAETASGKVYGDEKDFVTTSGLNDIEVNTMSVSLYPNPASTTSTLVVKGLVGEAKVIITDVQGRTINTFTMKSINGEATKSINVNEFAKGVYYVRIQNANTISTQKLIIR